MNTKDHYKNLPMKRAGAGAFIFNEKNELLIVKPNYKDYWSIPGGTIDLNESPRQACQREIKEEIGLEIKDVRFLCVDYTPAIGDKNESFQFAFYGGILSEEQIKKIKIQRSELDEYKFVHAEDAFKLFGGHVRNLAKRLPKCLDAIKTGTSIYLEDGVF